MTQTLWKLFYAWVLLLAAGTGTALLGGALWLAARGNALDLHFHDRYIALSAVRLLLLSVPLFAIAYLIWRARSAR
jgi:hypothetical protein